MSKEVWLQYRGDPIKGPISVSVWLYWKDRRKHDIDNIKGLLDSMTGLLWEDDSQIEELTVRKYYDKQNPRVRLLVTELSTPLIEV